MKKFMTMVFALFFATSIQAQKNSVLEVQSLEAKQLVPNTAAGEITGIAVNNSKNLIRNAFIKFKLYDENKVVVGNAIAHVSDIGPGEKWQFRAGAAVPFSTVVVSDINVY